MISSLININNHTKSTKWIFKGNRLSNDQNRKEFVKEKNSPIKYRIYGEVERKKNQIHREGRFETARLVNREQIRLWGNWLEERKIEP